MKRLAAECRINSKTERTMLDDIRGKAQSFGVKIIFLIIIVVFVFWGVGNFSGMRSGELAVVNGENLSLREYERSLRAAMEAERRNNKEGFTDEAKFDALKKRVLDEIILSTLRRQEARRIGIGISDYELKAYIDSFSVFQNAEGKFDPERYKAILEASGIKAGEFEEDSKKLLLEAKLMRYIGLSARFSEAEIRGLFDFSLEKRRAAYVLFRPADYRDKTEVTEEAIADYYEKNKESFRKPLLVSLDYLRLTPARLAHAYAPAEAEIEEVYKSDPERFKKPLTYSGSHIFIAAPPEGSTEPDAEKSIAAARAAILEIQAKLKAGGDFAELAREYSQDTQTAPGGGRFPTLEFGQSFSEDFDKAAVALKPGETSEPVRTVYGFHLIRLENLTEAAVAPLAEVRDNIAEEMSLERATKDFPAIEKKAEDEFLAGSDPARMAEQFKVPLESVKLASLADIEAATGLTDSRTLADAAAARAAGETDANLAAPVSIQDGIALMRITEARPSVIPSAEEMRASIVDTLRTRASIALARAAAESALPSFSGNETPEEHKGKVEESNVCLRVFPSVEPLGSVPDLVNGIFSSRGDWLPVVYDTDLGPVIARTSSVEPVREEDWEQLKSIFISQAMQSKESEAVESYMQALINAADIRQAEGALNQITLR